MKVHWVYKWLRRPRLQISRMLLSRTYSLMLKTVERHKSGQFLCHAAVFLTWAGTLVASCAISRQHHEVTVIRSEKMSSKKVQRFPCLNLWNGRKSNSFYTTIHLIHISTNVWRYHNLQLLQNAIFLHYCAVAPGTPLACSKKKHSSRP